MPDRMRGFIVQHVMVGPDGVQRLTVNLPTIQPLPRFCSAVRDATIADYLVKEDPTWIPTATARTSPT
jgi:hypothetical protein